MDRVAFLIEKNNQRIGCLLNPENLVMRRVAGVHPRQAATGQMTGAGLSDDPLLYTGGGRTELELSLLFDVSLAGSSVISDDIRDLTAPLWRLAENAQDVNAQDVSDRERPPIVRFIWGKAWNIPGIIVSVAERLEHFTPAGVPQRSWLRLRMWRTTEPTLSRARSTPPILPNVILPEPPSAPASGLRVHALLGGVGEAGIAASPELSMGQALVTSGDLIAAAINETPAAAWLFAACRQMGDMVGDALSSLGALIVGGGDSRVLETIRAAFTSIGQRTRAVLGEAKTRVVATATAASAHIVAALNVVGRQVRKATAPVARALSGALDAVMANVRPLARGLAQSAALIAQAVRAKAVRALARAMPYIEAGRSALSAALARVGTFVTEVGTQAAAVVRTVMQNIQDALSHLRRRGNTSPFAGIAASIGRIGPAIDALWAAGKRRTARLLNQAIPKLTLVIKNVLEAAGALAAVAGQQTRTMLTAAIEGVRSARAALSPDDVASLEVLQNAEVTLAASIESGASTASAAQWQAATAAHASVQAILEQVTTTSDAAALATVEPALDALATTLDTISATEEQLEAERVQQVLRATIPANLPESVPELAPGAGIDADAPISPDSDLTPASSTLPTRTRTVDFGERLDQLAFQYYGDAAYWRVLAATNAIDDPLRLATGLTLRVVPPARFGGAA